jgi:hypothetical protein
MIQLKVKFKDGKIKLDEKNKEIRNKFFKSLEDGSNLFMFIEKVNPDATALQIKMIHSCIGVVAKETDTLFSKVKYDLKLKTGLIIEYPDHTSEKSFKDCSKNEISNALKELIDTAKMYNVDLSKLHLEMD